MVVTPSCKCWATIPSLRSFLGHNFDRTWTGRERGHMATKPHFCPEWSQPKNFLTTKRGKSQGLGVGVTMPAVGDTDDRKKVQKFGNE